MRPSGSQAKARTLPPCFHCRGPLVVARSREDDSIRSGRGQRRVVGRPRHRLHELRVPDQILSDLPRGRVSKLHAVVGASGQNGPIGRPGRLADADPVGNVGRLVPSRGPSVAGSVPSWSRLAVCCRMLRRRLRCRAARGQPAQGPAVEAAPQSNVTRPSVGGQHRAVGRPGRVVDHVVAPLQQGASICPFEYPKYAAWSALAGGQGPARRPHRRIDAVKLTEDDAAGRSGLRIPEPDKRVGASSLDARVLPSGDQARQRMRLFSAGIGGSGCILSTRQRRMIPSSPAAAAVLPSGDHASRFKGVVDPFRRSARHPSGDLSPQVGRRPHRRRRPGRRSPATTPAARTTPPQSRALLVHLVGQSQSRTLAATAMARVLPSGANAASSRGQQLHAAESIRRGIPHPHGPVRGRRGQQRLGLVRRPGQDIDLLAMAHESAFQPAPRRVEQTDDAVRMGDRQPTAVGAVGQSLHRTATGSGGNRPALHAVESMPAGSPSAQGG